MVGISIGDSLCLDKVNDILIEVEELVVLLPTG